MRARWFLIILLFVAAFIGGLIASPYLETPRHELAEWVARPFSPRLESRVVTLYFSSPQEEYLVPERRTIPAISGVESQMKAVMQELILGPSAGEKLVPTLSSNTTVRAVYVRDETIYVDLSRAFADGQPGGTTGELTSIYSIVNTLLENFPRYSQVQLLVEGQPEATLAGHIDLRNPFPYANTMVRAANP